MALAFFDESGHVARPGYYGVAGLIGSDYQWSVFNRIWGETLTQTGAPYVHMREFAHSAGLFEGWKGDPRREQLMAGVIRAVTESRLTAIGSAVRMADFKALSEAERDRLGGSPYFGCLQDVLFGFALTSQQMPAGEVLAVTGDQSDYQARARQLYDVLLRSGHPYERMSPTLRFANMRETPELQGADVLTYEITKELSNQDLRPEDQMRWPLDQILTDQAMREIMMVVFRNHAYLQGQADGIIDTDVGMSIVDRDIDEMMRIYRERS
jgi:hypothetical protein